MRCPPFEVATRASWFSHMTGRDGTSHHLDREKHNVDERNDALQQYEHEISFEAPKIRNCE